MLALELPFTRGEYARRLAKVRWSFNVHQGIFSIICGPGSIAQAHKPDEFIAVGQLAACLEMLDKLRLKLATTAGSA
jgi:acetylornithine deacetylase/succinyl-diaminopimelate desuccinylase-like protein